MSTTSLPINLFNSWFHKVHMVLTLTLQMGKQGPERLGGCLGVTQLLRAALGLMPLQGSEGLFVMGSCWVRQPADPLAMCLHEITSYEDF